MFRTQIPKHFDVPRRLERLAELPYNLWWTWNAAAWRLYRDINAELWERVNHNPLVFLREIGRAELNAAAQNSHYLERYDAVLARFDAYMQEKQTWFRRRYPQAEAQRIAYFSMEYGLHEILPIYSGGLGVLSGDHLKEASDMGLPLVGVGFLYMEGYFSQRISEDGWQEALNNPLRFEDLPVLPVLAENGRPLTVTVPLPERDVAVRIWELRVGRVPLYLLDSNIPDNHPDDRQLTARLYWSDLNLRVMQEVVLGVGGVRALRALNCRPTVWHMNEGHSAFLTLERIRELTVEGLDFEQAAARTRGSNVFTTHTPVPAGNDEFPLWLVDKYLARLWPELGLSRDQFVNLARHRQAWGDAFSMPILALRFSAGRNGVSELHGRVARRMWRHLWPDRPVEEVPITHVTNGVHTDFWMARRLKALLEEYVGADWRAHLADQEYWERVNRIPDQALWEVHQHLKRKLVFYLRERARWRWIQGGFHPVQVVASGALLDPYALTIGFARRFATYKRAHLILSDVDRLLRILNRANRPVQIIFAGKAHPADEPGKHLIQEVYRIVKKAENGGRLVFLEDYDINLARYLVQGVDVWLNTPRRPNEASGTSGMKAAINGALNFSVLDGWWREAFNGKNGWAIGEDRDPGPDNAAQDRADAESLYRTLENAIIPLYYEDRGPDDLPHEWIERMKEALRTVTPQFSTRRMLSEYMERLYYPAMQNAAED